ncbi:MAG TPA: hypothetical protein PKE30_02795 [Niabella sp.]|nr:hypothetical protein [Niabella sp.]
MDRKCLYISLLLGVLVASCGTQKRMASTSQKLQEVKSFINEDSAALSKLQGSVKEKADNQTVDSLINATFTNVISSLRKDLEKNQRTVAAVEFFLKKRSNFAKNNYKARVKQHVDELDSFRLKNKTRDNIYGLLSEAVKVNAFYKYGMGAFFEPGIYKIAPSGFSMVSNAFMPAIDSMAALSNRYADVKRTAHLVIVGYADGLPVNPSSDLYAELKKHLGVSNPTNAELNQALSDLRASELLRVLKVIIQDNAAKFDSYDRLNIGYISYGRGQALPFKNITDYTYNDERRRVVIFYWAVLPDIEDL